jgi:hypothetical protein
MKWEGQVAVWREALSAVPELAGLGGPAEQFFSKMDALAEARHVDSNWGLFRRGSPAAIDAAYAPGNHGLWRKAKWLNRQELPSSAGPNWKERGLISGLCCSVTTPMTASSFKPTVWAQGC